MDTIITGYQYSPESFKYIGEYKFPNNLDQEAIHLPPFTVLEKPPETSGSDAAFWEDGQWVVKVNHLDLSVKEPEIEDYKLVTQSFIDWRKSTGTWTAQDEVKLAAAKAEIAAEEAAYEQAMQQAQNESSV